MRVRRLTIQNFRGVANGTVEFGGHTLLVGANNVGKSTVCEALDLVLGPERLYRRPVVDEHDFHKGRYLHEDGSLPEIRIEATLVHLPDEARRRFIRHLRRWDEAAGGFADEGEVVPEAADTEGAVWALPVMFVGRYDPEEDDFVGKTFFSHPSNALTETEPGEEQELGEGRSFFTREHKRLCGFVFLRALRTGSRALSLQRGSLLDTVLRLGGSGTSRMWEGTVSRLRNLDPAIGEIDQLKEISDQIRARMGQFVNLAAGDEATGFYASELTREHLREVVRFFVSVEPCAHELPFQRLGAGSINLLVFALLTFIAELKKKQSVIFAMEEPEIALPPHTQRRITRFILREMGQCIVSSHSPYVIEQFEPDQITILDRDVSGAFAGKPIDLGGVKPKLFTRERRQFAEAILSRAVLVVEGGTEAAVFPAGSAVMEADLGQNAYVHFDFEGVSVFNAGADNAVPKYGPIFAALGKKAFAFYDKPKVPFGSAESAQLSAFTQRWESPEKTIERLLIKGTPVAIVRRFLMAVKNRADYPSGLPKLQSGAKDEVVLELAEKVLLARKGDANGYARLLIGECTKASDLPPTVREVLEAIHSALSQPPLVDSSDAKKSDSNTSES